MDTVALFALIACCMIGVMAGAVISVVIIHELNEDPEADNGMKEVIMAYETDGDFVTGMKKIGMIVRCKDCKWFHTDESICDYMDDKDNMNGLVSCKPDDFCSYGERRNV